MVWNILATVVISWIICIIAIFSDKIKSALRRRQFRRKPSIKNFYLSIETRPKKFKPCCDADMSYPPYVDNWLSVHFEDKDLTKRFREQRRKTENLLDGISQIIRGFNLVSVFPVAKSSLEKIVKEFDENTSRLVRLTYYSNGVVTEENKTAFKKILDNNEVLLKRVSDFHDSLQAYVSSSVSDFDPTAGIELESITLAMNKVLEERKADLEELARRDATRLEILDRERRIANELHNSGTVNLQKTE